jgi:aspartate kinase
VIVVVSAMGKTTDKLLTLAKEVSPSAPRRELDMLLTTGEQVSIALMAMAIAAAGHEAISLTGGQLGLVTDSVHTQARIQSISRERVQRELAAGKIVIVAGFQGVDGSGEITTLGRGASDTTAAALAAVFQAEICEIYTDVDGVYSADPRIVPDARKIPVISYDEMLEMAAAGAKVMHSRSIEFGKKFAVPIHVRSSLTDASGTMIVEAATYEVAVRGVTLKEDLASITFTRVPNEPGVAAEIIAEAGRRRIHVDDIMQNVYADRRFADIGLILGAAQAEEALAMYGALAAARGLGGIEHKMGFSKVSAVGAGMRAQSGVAATLFAALAAAGINVETVSTSEIMISALVSAGEGARALQTLHKAFGLAGEATTQPGSSIDTAVPARDAWSAVGRVRAQ